MTPNSSYRCRAGQKTNMVNLMDTGKNRGPRGRSLRHRIHTTMQEMVWDQNRPIHEIHHP